jgi:hypothetical protein
MAVYVQLGVLPGTRGTASALGLPSETRIGGVASFFRASDVMSPPSCSECGCPLLLLLQVCDGVEGGGRA